MMFAAVVGHCSSRATPSLRYAPPRQSMEIVRGETIYRNRNAVQSNPATSVWGASCACTGPDSTAAAAATADNSMNVRFMAEPQRLS